MVPQPDTRQQVPGGRQRCRESGRVWMCLVSCTADFSSRSMMSWSWFRWVGLLWYRGWGIARATSLTCSPASTRARTCLPRYTLYPLRVQEAGGQRGPGACLQSRPQSHPSPARGLISKDVCFHTLDSSSLQSLCWDPLSTPPHLHQASSLPHAHHNPTPTSSSNSALPTHHPTHSLTPPLAPPGPTYSFRQCAAVRTHLGCTRTPPQSSRPCTCRAACQG